MKRMKKEWFGLRISVVNTYGAMAEQPTQKFQMGKGQVKKIHPCVG